MSVIEVLWAIARRWNIRSQWSFIFLFLLSSLSYNQSIDRPERELIFTETVCPFTVVHSSVSVVASVAVTKDLSTRLSWF